LQFGYPFELGLGIVVPVFELVALLGLGASDVADLLLLLAVRVELGLEFLGFQLSRAALVLPILVLSLEAVEVLVELVVKLLVLMDFEFVVFVFADEGVEFYLLPLEALDVLVLVGHEVVQAVDLLRQ